MSPNILLIHKNSDIVNDFQSVIKGNGTKLTPLHADQAISSKALAPNDLVVITAENNSAQVIHILEQFQKDEVPFYAIVSTAEMLKKTVHQIHETSRKLSPSPEEKDRRQQKTDRRKNGQANFSELIEKRLGEFVGKVRSHEGGNIFDLLMQEVEKPLLKMALFETKGNQVQAAQLLGIHRNTLRKKMKTLAISYVKKKI